ncbi:MAG: hypothetical protein ACO281_13235, partial [Burkholderiaceae bacterium]
HQAQAGSDKAGRYGGDKSVLGLACTLHTAKLDLSDPRQAVQRSLHHSIEGLEKFPRSSVNAHS